MEWVDVISRWAHVGTAIVLLGGAVFSRFVFLPSLAGLTEDERRNLSSLVLNRWKPLVHGGIALLLVSGFYNFVRALPIHKGQGAYHSLIGIKILLALGVFFIASALVGRSSAAETMRKNSFFWGGLIVILGAVIVAISGYAKVAMPGGPAAISLP